MDLASLRVLDLSGNQLTGPIPTELGDLARLFALNLSGNQLTGTIPQSFTSLMLEYFYFHGNPGLSVPDEVALREWLDGIKELRDQDYSPATPFVPGDPQLRWAKQFLLHLRADPDQSRNRRGKSDLHLHGS